MDASVTWVVSVLAFTWGMSTCFRRYASMKAIFIAFTCKFFKLFDVPVFWPILVIYFIVLVVATMKRQIAHVRFCFSRPGLIPVVMAAVLRASG